MGERRSSAARLSAAELTASAVAAPIITAPKIAADPEYREVCRDSPRKWRSRNPDYWKQYREKNLASADRTRQQQHPPSAAIAPTSATAASAELAAFFLVFYLEFHAEHVVVLSEPWLARPECANGVQVPVDALFPHVICFDAVRPHRETRRPLKERALVD